MKRKLEYAAFLIAVFAVCTSVSLGDSPIGIH